MSSPLHTKILLIAESVSGAASIQGMLRALPGRDFAVQHARDLAQGLALLAGRAFDAVLVDLELPGSEGLDAALAVRKSSATVPVLALTTHDDEALALAALRMDLQDCLVRSELSGPRLARAVALSIERKRGSELRRKSAEHLELRSVQLEEQNLELRRAQVEAEMLEEIYHNLYHFAPVGYITIDRKGNILEGNQEAAFLLGVKKVELAGFPLLSFLAPESMSIFAMFLWDIFHASSQQDCEVRLAPRSRAEWAMLQGAAMPSRATKRENCLIALIDLTERKRAEDRIVRLNETLSEQAGVLEEANKELETFNYTVAHDLRQPLNLIFLSCQALKAACGKRLSVSNLGFLDSAYRGVERMSELIETLLKFSMVGKVALKREEVDLSEIARQVAGGLHSAAPERRAVFEIAEGIRVNGDPDLLRVVLDNLFGNAWKFTASRAEAVIALGMADVGGKAAYFVRDNGTGFDMAEIGDIFSPFARLSGAKRHKGYGIGLATVERVIVRHGGRVWAEGEPGKGAIFYFTLVAPA